VPINLAASLIYDEGRAIASVGIFSDLRERIRMEEELAMAQRQLETSERQAAVVELAGSAAHELSQPLTTILGSAELMMRKLEPGSPSRAAAERIVSECERMAEVLRKIGRVAKYETKPYLGMTNILDLDAASDAAAENEEKS
jgi:signal transduction histidine kinase